MTSSEFDDKNGIKLEKEWTKVKEALMGLNPPESVLLKPSERPSARAFASWERVKRTIEGRRHSSFDSSLLSESISNSQEAAKGNRVQIDSLPYHQRYSRYTRYLVTAVSSVLVCLGLIGIADGWFGNGGWNRAGEIFQSSESGATPAVFATEKGNQATVNLPDGSSVLLNVASRLVVDPEFGRKNRRVELDGEAYFIVDQSSGEPFVVRTGEVATKVLGTEFSVRAYDDTDISIAVQSGRVSVDTAVVNSSEVVSVRGNELIRDSSESIANYTAFSQGKLVIESKPLKEAIPDINRWYNVDVILESPSLGDELIDAVLSQGSLENLIVILEKSFGATIHVEGRRLTVR